MDEKNVKIFNNVFHDHPLGPYEWVPDKNHYEFMADKHPTYLTEEQEQQRLEFEKQKELDRIKSEKTGGAGYAWYFAKYTIRCGSFDINTKSYLESKIQELKNRTKDSTF